MTTKEGFGVIRRPYEKHGISGFEELETSDGKTIELQLNGQLFVPVFRIEVPLTNLEKFVTELSALLAKPLKDAPMGIRQHLGG